MNLELLLQLGLIIISTKIAGDIAVRLGQPSVLGKLLIGVIIGPAILDWVQNSDVIEAFSQIGVLLLMFFAGLETNIKDLNANRNSSIAVALGGIVLPLIGGYSLGILVGMEHSHALFLGLLLSATSVSISVQTFKEMGQLKSKESTVVLGAALVDDIIVVIILAVMMSLLTVSDISLGLLLGKKAIFFVIIIFLGWKTVPFLMQKLASLRVTEPVISVGIVMCFLFAYLAELFGVAGIIGAFAAGLAISQTGFHKEVEQKLEPIAYSVFVPVFFVSIGLSVSFSGLSNYILFITSLSIIAILTKLIGSGLGAKLTGFNTHSSLVIGAGMISRGEVALIIATIGLNAGLLAQEYFTSIIIAVIISTIATPPMLKILLAKPEKLTS